LGDIALFGLDLRFVSGFNVKHAITDAAISPTGGLMALVTESRILLTSVDGRLQGDWEWTSGPHNAGGCVFSQDGNALFVAGKAGLWVIDTKTAQVVTSDPLAFVKESGFLLRLHPEGEIVGLWATGGPTETELFWSRLHQGHLVIYETPSVKDTGPPVFHPVGAEFLSFKNDGALARWQFPNSQESAQLDPQHVFPADTSGDPSDGFSEYVYYVSDYRAVVNTQNGLLYLVDLDSRKLIQQLILERYEPRTVRSTRPTVDHGWVEVEAQVGPVHSFSFAQPDRLFTIHHDDHSTNSVRLWDASSPLIGSIGTPSAMRPFTTQLTQIGTVFGDIQRGREP